MTIFSFNLLGITLAPTYYGLMYAIGFMSGYYIIKKRGLVLGDKLEDLFLYIVLGVILGGRLGYILFYNLHSYISNPLDILKVWEGGMSFHGGAIGVVISIFLFSKKYNITFYKLADQVALVLPIGLGLGRFGNYLNQELLGYSGYNGLLAVYKNDIGYFPSTLIEMLLEGVVLFLLLNYFYNKKTLSDGKIASLFLIFYGIFRIIVEILFRIPDIQIGYILGYFTMGEVLSLPMIIIGGLLYKKIK